MSSVVFPLTADERDRERELRVRFAQFWSTATGDPRTVYDTFISATPFAEGASQLASRTRRPVFVLDYPLAPEATVPAAPDAVLAAYEWLRTSGSADRPRR